MPIRSILLIACLIILCAFPIPGNSERIEPAEVQNSIEIKRLIETGLESILQKAYADKKITHKDFQLDKINKIEKQVSNGVKYTFDCRFRSKQNELIIATFKANYKRDAKVMKVKDVSYKVSTANVTKDVKDSYIEVDLSERQYHKEIQDVLKYGREECVKTAILDKLLRDAVYKLDSVKIVYKQVVDNSLFYKCHVNLKSEEGEAVDMIFTVYYQPISGLTLLVDYVITAPGVPAAAVVQQIIRPRDDQYVRMSDYEANYDPISSTIVQYGIEQIRKRGKNQSRIPNSDYTRSEIVDASSQIIGNWVFYKFNCVLQDTRDKNTPIAVSFIVSYHTQTNQSLLITYSYQVNSNQITTASETVTAVNPTQPVEGQYVDCSSVEIEDSRVIQDVLTSGTQEIYLKGVQTGRISELEFSITSIRNVLKYEIANGALYKCDVTLTNSLGSTLETTFTSFYQLDTKQISTLEWKYEISNNGSLNTDRAKKGNYKKISGAKVKSSSVIQDCLNYGIDKILKGAEKKEHIKNVKFDINKIISVSRKPAKYRSDVHYKFQVKLSNIEGSIITTDFDVYYVPCSKKRTLRTYSYKVTSFAKGIQPFRAAYTVVSQEEVDNDASLRVYIWKAIDQLIESTQKFAITKINAAQRQILDGKAYYKFDVDIENLKILTPITLRFTIFHKYGTNEKYITDYVYTINYKNTERPTFRFTQVGVSEIESNPLYQKVLETATRGFSVLEANSFAYQLIKDEYYRVNVKLVNEDGLHREGIYEVQRIFHNTDEGYLSKLAYLTESYTLDDTGRVIIEDSRMYDNYWLLNGTFERLKPDDYDKNSEVKACVDYGVKEAMQKIVERQEYVVDHFEMEEIRSIYRDSVDRNVYRIRVGLVNSEGARVECAFLVKSEGVSSPKEFLAYAYTSY